MQKPNVNPKLDLLYFKESLESLQGTTGVIFIAISRHILFLLTVSLDS